MQGMGTLSTASRLLKVFVTFLALLPLALSSCAFEETIPPVGTGTGISVGCETLDCDDNVACTVDSCENDACVHLPIHTTCDDGQFCNGVEQCHPERDCIAGTIVDTSDDVACTLDTCDEENDRIVHSPDDSMCGEPGFCFDSVTCDPMLDCVTGGPNPDIDDGIDCTLDLCDENADPKITHTPMDDRCSDDGLFCSGRPFCSVVNGDSGCQIAPGDVPIPGDGVSCTVDACDEDNDEFTYTADDSLCNDGFSCSADSCDAVEDCQLLARMAASVIRPSLTTATPTRTAQAPSFHPAEILRLMESSRTLCLKQTVHFAA